MNINTLMFTGTMVLSWILVVFALCLVPFFSRKNTAFGVSVPESEYHSEFLTRLRHRYFIVLLILSIALGAVSLLTQIWIDINISVWVQIISLFLYIGISVFMYLKFYFKVRKYKKDSGWKITNTAYASLKIDKNEKKPLNPLWFLSYLVIIIGVTLIGFAIYPSLPDQLPMHYNIAGQVDRYAAKSMGTILTIPIMQIIMSLMFFGIYYAILKAKNQSSGSDIEEGLKKDRAFKIIMSKFIFFTGLAIMVLFGITQLSMLGLIGINITIAAPIVLLIVIFVVIAYLAVKVGQGGSRMGSSKNTGSMAVEDDNNWIFGLIYYNKDDPSLFVEKRFGMGYTINFGSSAGRIAIAALILLIAASLVLPLILH